MMTTRKCLINNFITALMSKTRALYINHCDIPFIALCRQCRGKHKEKEARGKGNSPIDLKQASGMNSHVKYRFTFCDKICFLNKKYQLDDRTHVFIK